MAVVDERRLIEDKSTLANLKAAALAYCHHGSGRFRFGLELAAINAGVLRSLQDFADQTHPGV